MSVTYNYSKYTPVDSTRTELSIFKSAYANVRFALALDKIIVLREVDVADLPGLAFRHYGDVSLWRLLLAYNGMNDPLQDLYPGLRFRLPTKASITQYLSSQRNTRRERISI